METLSDEVLLNILELASTGQDHHMMRAILPMVCKRWSIAICGTKGWATHGDHWLSLED